MVTSTRASGELCPACGSKGKPVRAVTLESLLEPEARGRISDLNGCRFCATADCDVVYYGSVPDARVERREVRVPVWQKEQDPDRPVCYCFGHTDREIRDQVASHGTSTVPEEITEQCRQGLDRCEQENPQSTCCLGNVRSVMKQAQLDARESAAGGSQSGGAAVTACCAPTDHDAPATADGSRASRLGVWATGGSLLSAVLASACCWLPLLLIALGASAGGVGAVFETWRPWLLGVAALLLAVGFYLTYLRKPRCEPGDSCELPSPRVRALNHALFWVASAFVAAFAFFPSYVSLLLGGSESGTLVVHEGDAAQDVLVRELTLEGMTCEACAVHVRSALEAIPGVVGVEVRYEEARALVQIDPNAAVDDSRLLEAIGGAGYEARILDPTAPVGPAPIAASRMQE